MSTGLVWSNIFAYSLQIGLVVGLGALVPAALRMRMPRARLLYWQVLLVACLALPWIRSWRQEVIAGAIQVSTVVTAVSSSAAPVHRAIPFMAIALWLLATGVAIRLGLLIAGLVRLSAYRRRGRELPSELRMPGAAAQATPLLSDDVAGPVTFGWRNPVVLLPASFSSLEGEMRDAILCHELLHVARRDWLFTIAEELVRAVLWFHPAVWWVIGEIQLAREQTVDQLVIETTQARGPYVDTLLLMAGAFAANGGQTQLDLAPAPMFLRRRHLKRRLLEVVKEVGMTTISKTRLVCITAAAVVMVAAACWLATAAFPLSAAPQIVDDAAGVAVNVNGSQLMHRSRVPYPAEALAKGIEGTIVVQLKLDNDAEVSDAAVLSGPDEFRKSVLQSVLSWHFDKSLAFTTQTVNIDFAKPPNTPSAAVRQALPTTLPSTLPTGKLERIAISGLSDFYRDELASKLPVHEGDDWYPQILTAVNRTAKAFDSHLNTILVRYSHGGFELRISPASTRPTPTQTGRLYVLDETPAAASTPASSGNSVARPGVAPSSAAPKPDVAPTAISANYEPLPSDVYSVGNGTTAPVLLLHPDPQYSEQARAAKYSGEVMLSIVVGTDGTAGNIHVIKSLGMGLDEKAAEAVRQWVFRPGTHQGVPVNVRANVAVNFRLL